jgi:ribonuclease E
VWAAAALERAAPARAPRGAFLLPDAAARIFGVTAGAAESIRPNIGIALDLVAAGQVAEAAGEHATQATIAAALAASPAARALGFTAPGAAGTADRTGTAGELVAGTAASPATAGSLPPGATPEELAELSAGGTAAGTAMRGLAEAARAHLPPALWPVFDAVYISLGEDAETRPLAPSARAARALALTSRAAAGSGEALPARARAAAAWAVLPVILTGGAASPAEPAAGRAAAPHTTLVDGTRPRSVTRAGEALGALVAPTLFADDHRAAASAQASTTSSARGEARRPGVSTPFIETAAPPRPAPAPQQQAQPAPAPRPSAPAAQTSTPDMAWFVEAAKKYFGDAGPSSGGITLAEMTLVTAAPRTQIAASARTADRVVTQSASTTNVGGDSSKPGGPPVVGKPDVDKIAQEVFEQICRMMAVARERSGDPWQR